MTITVLYIEDNTPNVVVVDRIMENLGYQLIVATSAAEGLEIATRDHPDIILMDVRLPDMDGLTATRQLRANPETAAIPIIAVTANALVGDRERCLAAGCNDYIQKPFQVKTLSTIVRQFIPEKLR